MSEWLRGSPGAPALAFGGDVVRVGELAAAVAAARLPGGTGLVPCPVGTAPVELITTVLAALERGRPVLVGGSSDEARRLDDLLPAATAIALRTSGSSGTAPTVVARTEASWLESAAPLAQLAGIEAGDRVAVTGPLHVSMHLYAALHALWAGAVVGDSVRDATVVHATPTRLARLLDGGLDARAAVVAGAALPERVRHTARARLRLTEYYGAAELSFVAAGHGEGLVAFPGAEIELREAAGGRELWVRSPYLAIDAVGGMLRRDAAGFATVGDLAELGADGTLTILGRGDAAITTAGATVIAERIEGVLAGLPGVAAVAVVGEPNELLGERVVAIVELDELDELDERVRATDRDAFGGDDEAADPRDATDLRDEIVAEARARLEVAELPRRWFFAPLPRTDSGKVARGALRSALAAGGLDGEHRAAARRHDAIRAVAAGAAPTNAAPPTGGPA
ncbi:AMP-binding protein [Agromyces sp. S2-1-8]|uniref:AMP-binding enzyme n=1 Tax=Agromyces sp. S2-1-8 TaxID=2897180 RepID=UPI001E3EF1EE|nr:AMP-binding protein [Agromyces sp. S2-1-8]MCD5346762.1 AMP-binding protein [Agromyces sp. S2-1-8]